jgi:hypothetical protein
MGGNVALCQGEFVSGFQQIGQGLLMTSAGLGAIVDIPLSLAADIVTFPVAYARYKEYPWATWWGEPSRFNPISPPTTTPEEGKSNTSDKDQTSAGRHAPEVLPTGVAEPVPHKGTIAMLIAGEILPANYANAEEGKGR